MNSSVSWTRTMLLKLAIKFIPPGQELLLHRTGYQPPARHSTYAHTGEQSGRGEGCHTGNTGNAGDITAVNSLNTAHRRLTRDEELTSTRVVSSPPSRLLFIIGGILYHRYTIHSGTRVEDNDGRMNTSSKEYHDVGRRRGNARRSFTSSGPRFSGEQPLVYRRV